MNSDTKTVEFIDDESGNFATTVENVDYMEKTVGGYHIQTARGAMFDLKGVKISLIQ